MKLFYILLTSLLLLSNANGEKNLFDGKTLKGWNGDPKFWSVQNGSIVGQTTKENPTKGNTFIIWKGGKMNDFDLTLDYKIEAGNSGIQYRSFVKPGKNDGWRIGGYQADLEAGDKFSGICYGEGFRGILSMRGEKTVLTLDGKGKLKKEYNGVDTSDLTRWYSDEEMKKRKSIWIQPNYKANKGVLKKYINSVATASEGCVTDQ